MKINLCFARKTFSIVLVLLAAWPVAAIEKSATKIELQSGGKTVAVVGDLQGLLQVRADKSKPGSKQGTSILTGNVRITSVTQGHRTAHIQADEAILETGRIEMQVYDYVNNEQVGWINQLEDFARIPILPMAALSRALKAHPDVSRFRMAFGMQMGGSQSGSVVLYDRNQKTVKYREVGSFSEGDTGYETNCLYTGVTDSIIHRMVEQHSKDRGGFTDAYFHLLTNYGCKLTKLSG